MSLVRASGSVARSDPNLFLEGETSGLVNSTMHDPDAVPRGNMPRSKRIDEPRVGAHTSERDFRGRRGTW